MTKPRTVALCMAITLSMLNVPAGGAARLDMRLTPKVSWAPASVRVLITVEANAANRLLEVVAETDDFLRSSEISLDGARAPRVSAFEFRDLPTGVYKVTGTLADESGARTSVTRTLMVVEGRGLSR